MWMEEGMKVLRVSGAYVIRGWAVDLGHAICTHENMQYGKTEIQKLRCPRKSVFGERTAAV